MATSVLMRDQYNDGLAVTWFNFAYLKKMSMYEFLLFLGF